MCCGCGNIAIGSRALFPSATGNKQLIIATCTYSADTNARCVNYFAGCQSSEGCTHVSIGTTDVDGVVGSGLTSKLSVGIVSAYQLYGDGSNLTGISAGGFTPDDQCNLVAGCDAGANLTSNDCFNVTIGHKAGCKFGADSEDDDRNIAIGFYAGRTHCGGSDNVFLGSYAGCGGNGSVNENNVFIGKFAGGSNCSGCHNTYISCAAGNQRASGSYNFIVGKCAGQCGVGLYNIIFGNQAGRGSNAACSSSHNVLMGKYAGKCVTTGGYNTFIGTQVGRYLTTGRKNVAIGCQALALGNPLTGNYNTALGTNAGRCSTSTIYNFFGGYSAGRCTNTGSRNTFIGAYTGCDNTTGSCSVAIGNKVQLASDSGGCQLAIGADTNHWIDGDSNYNVGIGTTTPSEKLHVCGSIHADLFFQNPTSLAANTTFPSSGTKNGGVFGPYTIASGVTFTISSGSTFTII